ncbi:MAG TPA: alpha-2-macroglobulin family protein [Pyrinomonadaceae bacterium]|nr:alpha-2-macroglobulin family protein [Pyrinomonadaceae bacterium]
MKLKRSLSLLLIYTFWLTTFAPFISAQNSKKTDETEEKGLTFRLRQGVFEADKRTEKQTPTVTNLTDAEANAIFRRLPRIPVDAVEKSDFKLRGESLPAPKAGKIIQAKFPTDESQNAPIAENNSKLEVVRYSPFGAIPIAPELSVTFSQAMIAVSSQTEASENVPVVLSPQVKGKWRWLGTKTLIFDAEQRFPMATKFTAKIPKGTKSAVGRILEKDISWNFETPPVKIESFSPNSETVKPDALVFAKFNQDIDPQAILLKTTALTNNRKIALRLVTNEEIAANEQISKEIKEILPNRFVVFRAVENFPLDSLVIVHFDKDLPSAEGNLTTTQPQTFSFKTYSALKFREANCGYGNDKSCDYYDTLRIDFNNLLDEESFDKSLVKIEPQIEEAKITTRRNSIQIDGVKAFSTKYKITVSGALKDQFGQILGKDISAEFLTDKEKIEPGIYLEGEDFITLDPNGNKIYSILSKGYKNLKIRLLSVNAEDYLKFLELDEDSVNISPNFGKLVYEKKVNLKIKNDFTEETKIDINRALKNGFGHALLIVETPDGKNEVVKWIQSTQIGITAISDYEELFAYVGELKNGKPIENAQISFLNGEQTTTNSNGTATLKLPVNRKEKSGLLIAKRGDDSAILAEEYSYEPQNADWLGQPQTDSLRWFVFNDRNMYRPTETVSIKGYVRKFTGGKFGDIAFSDDSAKRLNYILKDSRGNEVLRGNTELNIFGAFDFQIKLPENINLGYQKLELRPENEGWKNVFTHQFQVQEFRRPEFEVSAKREENTPLYVGDSAQVVTEAKYFAGGALSKAETNWTVTATPTSYTPPNRDDFTFGKFIPWWRYYYDGDSYKTTTETFKGATNFEGKNHLAIDLVSANPARPYNVKAEARVQDVNRQTFAASTEFLVHPADIYVGIRTPETFVEKGEKLKIETIVTDIDGNAVDVVNVAVKAELKDWQKIKGEWQNVTIDTKTCEIVSAKEAVSCEFLADKSGNFKITASVSDKKGRRNESELDVWVAGGQREPQREVTQESVELIPNKKDYAPNDTAEILVNAPFFPAEGVLTLQRNGIVKTERFSMNSASTVLKIPITEQYLPNLTVQVDLNGAAERIWFEDERDAKLPKRPAFASGEIELDISTASRKLQVSAETLEKTLEPGGKTKVKLNVKDFQGNAVANSEIAVVAVDESVIALTNYKIENPADTFYEKFTAQTSSYYSRENILLSSPEDLEDGEGRGFGYGSGNGMGSGSGSGGGGGGRDDGISFGLYDISKSPDLPAQFMTKGYINRPLNEQPIKLRSNFNALAVFAPSVKTDGNGDAVVDLNLPDNLTRYRITAIAANEKSFGKGESNLTARLPLMIRASAPRFMNLGDAAELPVVLQNQSDSAMTIDVAIRATNANLTDGNGRKITIPANDRAEIRFPVSPDKTGNALFQIGAVSGKFADAAEFAFPVYTPATTEAFATYGTTDENGAIFQTVSAPKNVLPNYGGLEISTSSTQLQELTDAFIYLQNYPFECSEQRSSRVLSVAALRDVLTAFQTKDLPSLKEIEAKMNADIAELKKLQHKDGGFSFWRNDDESIPYVTVHVAHALARLKLKNYDVPKEMLEKANDYLKNIETKYQSYYQTKTRQPISAYALYVRNLLGDKDAGKAKKILKDTNIDNISVETLGWVLNVLSGDKYSSAEIQAIKQSLLKRVTETADKAFFTTDYKDGQYLILSSARRADAVVLEALLSEPPAVAGGLNANSSFTDLIPKLARGLLESRDHGRWSSTQENAFVLLALDKYFHVYEKVTPDFVAKVWLGNNYAGEQKFVGRTTETRLTNVPMELLQSGNPTQNLVLDKQGAGRLYYRIGLKYAPNDLRLESADYGFTVTRKYEAIDNTEDVKQNADGSWTIKSGERIRVKLQMIAPVSRYHVALVDSLPAGFEIVNSELANAESLPKSSDIKPMNWDYRYRSRWFEHQNLRDNRAEAFAQFLGSGIWNYEYVVRATTPGNFVAPPAKAEEMYSPEVFGRTSTEFVLVR